jgi:putative hydrolase of the HAD superfamily
MRAILIPHSDIPAEQAGPVAGEPDAVVQRLGEVLDVVDRWC